MLNKKTAAAFALLAMSGAALTLSQTAAAQTVITQPQPSGVLSLSAQASAQGFLQWISGSRPWFVHDQSTWWSTRPPSAFTGPQMTYHSWMPAPRRRDPRDRSSRC